MNVKETIRQILKKEYGAEPAWRAFIFWWLAANGYDHEADRGPVKFVDGCQDGGIDVIAWPLEHQGRQEILVVQSKFFGQPPTEKDLGRFQAALDALHGNLSEFEDWLATCRPELHESYRRLRAERRRHRYILITPCRMDAGSRRYWASKGMEVQDADHLANLERNYTEGRTPRLEQLALPAATSPRKVASANGTAVWILTIAARDLGLAYQRHGNALFAGNIRYALRGQTARRVRSGMLETLEQHPHEFVYSHNGITVTGNRIQHRAGRVVMHSATIVNGAQTVSFFGSPVAMKRLSRNPSRVIVKFVQVKDAALLNDIESKVAFRSNNQNKVDPSDLMIELASLVSLQRYFRRQGIHLERKKGEQKVRYGEPGIAKERLAQVLAAVESPKGAVKGKRKQELFHDSAHRLFSDYDASEEARAEAVAWTRVDGVFQWAIWEIANRKRRKRAQLAQLAALTVFHGVLRSTGLKSGFLRIMRNRWADNEGTIEWFLVRSYKLIISALLRCSSEDRKNEPAFYKAVESVKPAVKKAIWRSRRRIRELYHECFGH